MRGEIKVPEGARLMAHVSLIDMTKEERYHDERVECSDRDAGTIYRAFASEYGRCVSRVFRDPPGGGQPEAIGWVFVKRVPYDDKPTKTYLRGAWVSLYTEMPAVRKPVRLGGMR